LAVHHIGQHRPELLALAALNLVEPDVARPPFDARVIPFSKKRLFRSARFAPAHPVAHRRMTRRHRLAVDADLLPQATSDAGLRLREVDPLRPNPAAPALHATLAIDQ